MQLIHFLVVIVSLGCGSVSADDRGLLWPLLATTVTLVLWGGLCRIGAIAISNSVRSGDLEPIDGARCLEWQLAGLRWLSLAAIVLCLVGFQLAANVQTAPILKASMFLQAIVLLSPGMIMILSNWSAEQAYGERLGYAPRSFSHHVHSLWSSFRFSLGWIIAPVLFLLAVADLLGTLPIGKQTASTLTVIVVFGCVAFLMPVVIRRLILTESMDQEYGQWLDSLLDAAGVRNVRCVRWNTNARQFNAMIAGIFGRTRTLLVSDRVLDELPRDQVAMIILHEAAHARRHHVLIRVIAVLPAWIAGMLVSSIARESTWAAPLGTLAAILFTVLILRIVSYRTELDADAVACQLAEKVSNRVRDVPASKLEAVNAMSYALLRVTSENPASRKPTWLHPSVADRIESLSRQRGDVQSTCEAEAAANPA